MSDLARRRFLLTAALGFAPVDTQGKSAPKEIQLARVARQLEGSRQIVVGMERQGYAPARGV